MRRIRAWHRTISFMIAPERLMDEIDRKLIG